MEPASNESINILFGFSFPVFPEGLSNSILSIGQINPILISSISGRRTIVSGHRRFFILERAKVEPVFFELPSTTIETGLVMYLVENLNIRRFNAVERVRICRFITNNNINLPPHIIAEARLGDLKRNSNLYEFVESLSEGDQLVIAKKDMSTGLMERLKRMGSTATRRILQLVDLKNLTHQETRGLIEDLYFVFMRGDNIDGILSEIERLEFEEIREYLKSLINPVLKKMVEEFSNFVKDYRSIEIEPPQNFEGDWYELKGRFRDEEDLSRIIREIEDLLGRWKKNPILR